ncbi:MAG: septum formation initiator family protein [Gemmatimonadota bacterium]
MREPWRRLGFRALIGGLWIVAGYYLLFGGGISALGLRELGREERAARARLDSLSAVVDSLGLRADSLETDPAAIERTARNEYGLLRDGERVFFFEPAEGEGAGARDTAQSLTVP